MRTFRQFISESFLDEAISKEFKDLAGPHVLTKLGDYLASVDLSVQNAEFRKLSDSEKASVKRKLSDKKLDELPFGERFLVFVIPYDKDFDDYIKNLQRNPNKIDAKYDRSNLGNIWIVNRISGYIYHIWVEVMPGRYDYKTDTYVTAPYIFLHSGIVKGATSEFKNLISSKNTVAFTFDNADSLKQLHQDRYNASQNNDPLKPENSWSDKTVLAREREKKFNQIKNNTAIFKYKDDVKKLCNDTLKNLDDIIKQFFKEKENNSSVYPSSLIALSRFRDKIEELYDILSDFNNAGSSYTFSDYSKDLENKIKKFKSK